MGRATIKGLVMAIAALFVIVGCDRNEECELHLSNPYKIGELELNGVDEMQPWAPEDADVLRWVERALDDSHRGISRSEGGMEMRATLSRRVQLEQFADRSRLIVGLEAQVERVIVPSGAPMVFLTADVEYRHTMAERAPSEEVLRALTRTLERRAVGDVVNKLRLRARIRQSGPAELSSWVTDSSIPATERIYAMRRAQHQGSTQIEKALSEAAADEDVHVAVAAARTLLEMESARAAHQLMAVAQRMSRDREYDHYLELLAMLGRLDDAWISIYLETVADAHRFQGARARARELVADRPPPVQADSLAVERPN